ncbi:hypothetical protein WICMUC_001348 [Wickerhamomyces mucosus]|uniref:Kinase n=1 Tax=Wickerhamomyces mucosus TaxID=1378264 RepID=A0A9P8PX91_9ASCO|nr:hypothetical protein WICMUC_001348 [Wickerhamomyces mucosus]
MTAYSRAKYQAAGHDGALIDESGSLFIKPTNDQEIEFYTKINELERSTDYNKDKQDDDDDDGMKLIDWIPNFMGILEKGITNEIKEKQVISEEYTKEFSNNKDNNEKYLVLENLLHGFKSPSIIDIKLGSILTDEFATKEKKLRLQKISDSTTSGNLSFRVCGMKLVHKENEEENNLNLLINSYPNISNLKQFITIGEDNYISFNKFYGRGLNISTIVNNFQIFFKYNKLSTSQQQKIIRNTFTRLQLLYNCLLEKEIRIISGSLLLVYENDLDRWNEFDNHDPIFRDYYEINDDDDDDDDDDEHDQKQAPLSLLSMIDFAHSKIVPGKGYDENIIKGVENLMNLIETMIDE